MLFSRPSWFTMLLSLCPNLLFGIVIACSAAVVVSGLTTLEDLLPTVLGRMAEVGRVLAPLPTDTLQEALFHAASYYIPVDADGRLCKIHSDMLFDSFLKYDLWALKMVDASSKVGSGVLDGNMMDLGNYDQCLSVRAPGGVFSGQHCVVETRGVLPHHMEMYNPKRPVLPTLRIDLMFSMCVPSSCSAADVKTHMDIALNSVNATAILYNTSCSSATPLPIHRADVITILILVVICVTIVLSTCFDTANAADAGAVAVVLRCWSLRRNTHRLLDTSLSPDHDDPLRCLHGVRVLAMAWLMLGYRMLHLLACPNFRFKYLAENIDSLLWAPVENAQLAVEVFLVIAGALITYNYCRARRAGNVFSYVQFVLTHYIRLTPPLALMTLLYATIMIRVSDGPIWRRLFGFEQQFCQTHWWSNLLYLSNYINPYEMCLPQTWYLAMEFQMYSLSPLLLTLLYHSPRRGVLLLMTTLLASVAGGMANAYALQIQAGGLIRIDRTLEGTNVLDYFYTQYRLSSFLLGVLLGYVIFKIKYDSYIIKMSKSQACLGWLCAVCLGVSATLAVSVFQDPQYEYTPWLDTTYGILHRPALGTAVSWVILACTLGYGGVVNTVLTWTALVPLSRLTYCVFLVHYVVQNIQAFSTRTPVNIDFLTLWYMFFADFFISYLLAAVLYLTVEAPVNNIIAAITKGSRTAKEHNRTDNHRPVFVNESFVPDVPVQTEKIEVD